MNTIFLKPMKGRRVLDPAQTPPSPLPPEGRRVVDSPYWRSRIKDGVVEVVDQGPALDPDTPATEPSSPSIAKQSAANKGVQGPPAPGKKEV